MCVIFGIIVFLISSKILSIIFGNRFKCNRKQINKPNVNRTLKIDLSETEEQYIIEAEIPGVQKENIDVKIERDLLNRQNITIKTVKNENIENKESNENKNFTEESNEKKNEGEKAKYLIKERSEQQLERVIPLIQPVNEESIVAKYEDGILKIFLSKLNSHKIKIE
jgi:HSP20 family protein